MLSGFVLACELFLANQRTMAGLLLTLYWPLGMVLLAAAAYFTRHWRHLLIVTSTPGLLLIPLFWLASQAFESCNAVFHRCVVAFFVSPVNYREIERDGERETV